MRFRLATKPPLKPFKAWFDIPNDNSVLDILDVKAQICSRVSQLADDDKSCFSSVEIDLFIDDFELLDDSSLQVIKENDLIYITRKRHLSNQKKRKAANNHEPSRKKQRVAEEQTRKKLRSPSMSSTSTSSEDGESSSSATTSSSESLSSESESESSSSDSSVEVQSSKLLQPVKAFVSKHRNNPIVHPIPPGEGKASTHSRNARRRIKRLHENEQKRVEQAATQALSSGSANAMPLGTQNVVVGTQVEGAGASQALPASPTAEQGSSFEVEGMVTTLRNKNKKKGFQRAMAGLTPQKIIFSDETGAPPESTSTFYSAVSTAPATPRTAIPRLITPSEKQAQGHLPSNMFVTSVEVEGDRWDKTKKKKQRNLYGYDIAGDEFREDGTAAEQETILNYGEPEVDWTSIEQGWDNLANVSDMSSLKVGGLIGWKALAINPATFSPETLVHLGRIKEIKHESSSIVLEPIRRPGTGEIAFGAFSIADNSEDEEAKSEAVEDEVYTFEDALKAPWKLVDRTG